MYKADYFIYKNVAYGIGTKVKFNANAKVDYYHRPYSKTPVFEFVSGFDNGKKCFNYITSDNILRARVTMQTLNPLDDVIEEIVHPVYVKLVSWQEKALDNMLNGMVSPDVFGGVLLYIVAMIVGAIFKARLLIWFFATAVFIWWLLNQYRT